MICLFLNTNDTAGTWLYRSLLQRGINNLVMISAEELVYAEDFSCGINASGPWFSITLRNGLQLTNNTIHRVLNRISFLPGKQINQFVKDDQAYVSQEQMAIFTFLFRIFPNQLFNSASGRGLSGQYRSQLEWMNLAHQNGIKYLETGYEFFKLHYYPAAPPQDIVNILYFNGQCINSCQAVPNELYKACGQLGHMAGEKIIEFQFQPSPQGWLFSGASTHPSFLGNQETFLNALIPLL